ncbi:MAG: Ig-like domain-containing protein [Bacteroidales bacterium]
MRLFTIPHTLYPIPLLLLLFAAALPALADGTININNPSAGTGWTFADSVVTITANGNYTVTGTSTANRIVINKNVTATITLQNANIHSAVASPFALSSDTIAGGIGSQVTLNLSGSNELVTTNIYSAGLTVEDSAKIIIEGAGSLLAQGAGVNPRGGAGIGGGNGKTAGTVIIQSGTITATGGYGSAGIGGGRTGSGGNITIAGGTVTATGGQYGAGIGGGRLGNGGNITVTGGTITATNGSFAAGIGGGHEGSGGNITVTGGAIIATGNRGAGIGGGWGGEGGNIIVTGGTITATDGSGGAGIGGGENASGGNITVTGGTINATGGSSTAGIGGGMYGNGGNITINGGTITAIGGSFAAGIGGGWNGDGGNITIHGGAIVAVSGGSTGDPAGIGGGGSAGAGTVNITGGTVYASGGTGAGIGGGASATEGVINITGGTVIADEIGIGNANGSTQTSISGANTVVLSPSINTTTFGGATVLNGNNVNISITTGDTVADVTLNAALTIPSGATLVVPAGIVFDVNHKALTNNGIIRQYGTIKNTGSLTVNQPVGAIQAGWISIPSQTYTGDSIKPTISVTNGTLTLAHGAHYTITAYANNVNAGTATVTVTDLGDYSIVSKTFTIAPKALADGFIQNIPAQTYTGDSIKPAVTVKDNTKTLTLNTDYTVAYTNNVKAGTATVTVTGKGNYAGSASKTFIIAQPLAGVWIEDIPTQTYTGDSIKPAVVVRDGSKTLTPGADYTVAYMNNVNPGTATATVTGTGSYAGSASKTFIIAQPLAGVWIEDIPAQTYTGDSIKPAIVVRDGSKILTPGTDYTVAWINNVNAGTATVTVTGKGNYAGSVSKNFIIAKPLTVEWLDNISLRYYTGDSIEPYVIVRDGSKILTFETDYIVTYRNNVYPGTATVTVTGIGNYTGIVTKTFIITKSFSAVSIEDIPAQTYTGDSIKPAIMARDGNALLTAGRDYTVRYESNTGVGTALATITGAGDYTGAQSKIFAINPRPIATEWLEDPPTQTYTGSEVKPPLTVRDESGFVLTSALHYYVSYLNNVNAGTATALVTGVGNYTGTAGKPFTINPKSVSAQWIGDIPAQTYTGVAVEPALTVKDGYNILTAGVHYSATYFNNVDAGTATVTITGMGNYTGTASKTFAIVTEPVPITAGWIEDIPAQSYTGESITPAVVVRDGSATLILNTDYTVAYINNVNAGTATVTVTGVGNYTGSASKTFLIVKPLAGVWLEDIPAQTYTGSSIQPAITVWDGSNLLAAGIHYSVTWMNNVNAGTATVTVTGLGNYSGTASKSFTIHPKAVAADWLEDIPAQAYTGKYIEPGVVVRDGSKTLTLGADYTVAYMNNTYIGTATATVTGMGNYVGSASKNFAIIAGPNYITAEWLGYISPQTYTGSSIQPEIVVKAGDKVLTRGVDYTVGYSNNINAGTATVGVIGMGDYIGTANKTFTILPKAVAGDWLEDIPTQYYTGSPVELSLTIRDGARILTQGTDYLLDYTNNIYVGTARVTLTGKGNYTGTATGTFKIIRNGIPIQESWVQVIPDQYYTGASVRPKVIVTGLVEGVDYTAVYFNNIEAGTAWVTVVGIGSYAGEVTLYFRIIATGAEEPASAALRIAPAAAGGILVSGLTPGKTLSIYTLQGQLLYQATATSPEETIYLREKGVYILYHDGQYSKFAY